MKKDELKNELNKIQSAFSKIASLWHYETDYCDNVLQENYPFEESFAEVAVKVVDWAEAAKKKIEKDKL